MIKSITVLSIIAITITQVYSAATESDPIKQYNLDCQKLSKIDDATLKNICKGVIADDPKVRSHMYCFSKKMGFQNEKGEIQLEGTRKGLTDYLLRNLDKLMADCFVTKATPEESAFEALKCVHKSKPQDHTTLI